MFYKSKARSSTNKKITVCFIATLALLWSGTKPAVSLRYACILFACLRKSTFNTWGRYYVTIFIFFQSHKGIPISYRCLSDVAVISLFYNRLNTLASGIKQNLYCNLVNCQDCSLVTWCHVNTELSLELAGGGGRITLSRYGCQVTQCQQIFQTTLSLNLLKN